MFSRTMSPPSACRNGRTLAMIDSTRSLLIMRTSKRNGRAIEVAAGFPEDLSLSLTKRRKASPGIAKYSPASAGKSPRAQTVLTSLTFSTQ
jgi:hypothetical protein